MLTLVDPYFAQQIIEKYSRPGTGSPEAVDFVYYKPENQGQASHQTNLFLQMLLRFQMLHFNTFISAGHQQMIDQVQSHVMNRILVRIMTKKEQRAALAQLDGALKKIQKVSINESFFVKREDQITKESMRLLSFLKEQPELLSEKETFVRLVEDSGGNEAKNLVYQYLFSEEEPFPDNKELDGQLQTIIQNIVKKNQRQLSVLFEQAKILELLENTGSEEKILLYEAVRLLFREPGNHSREWERLVTLTDQHLSKKKDTEIHLRQEHEEEHGGDLAEETVESPELVILHMLLEKEPEVFVKLLKEAGITELPEFQSQLEQVRRMVHSENQALLHHPENQDLLKQAEKVKPVKTEVLPTVTGIKEGEEGYLLYETVRLLFREPGNHSREWERLVTLTGQHLSKKKDTEIHLHQEHEEENGRDLAEEAVESPELVTLHTLLEKEPKVFVELLKEAGITELPEFQGQLEQVRRMVHPENEALHYHPESQALLHQSENQDLKQGEKVKTEVLSMGTGIEGVEEGHLLYETVRLLFREPGKHSQEWERLVTLTDRHLSKEKDVEIHLRQELGGDIAEKAEEYKELVTLHTLLKKEPEVFVELLREAGITELPEFQSQWERVRRMVHPGKQILLHQLENQALYHHPENQDLLKQAGKVKKVETVKTVELPTGIGIEEGEEVNLLYETVRLLFREPGSHSQEWERLVTLTDQHLGKDKNTEIHLRQELGEELGGNTAKEAVEPSELITLHRLLEKEPEIFVELLKEAGITKLPEFQNQLEQVRKRVHPENQALLHHPENQDLIRQGEKVRPAKTVELPIGTGIEENEKGNLLYETIRLLFREPGNHSREWERLVTLTGQHVNKEKDTEIYLRQKLEGDTAEKAIEPPELVTLHTLLEKEPEVFAELLKEAGITKLPEFQSQLKQVRRMVHPENQSLLNQGGKAKAITFPSNIENEEGRLLYETVRLLFRESESSGQQWETFTIQRPSVPLLNVRERADTKGNVKEQLEKMPAATLQFMQRKLPKEQELKENRNRIQKLEEQIQVQQKTVTQLSEGQHIQAQTLLPDVNDLTRKVMSNLEREFRLEKMRKGLL